MCGVVEPGTDLDLSWETFKILTRVRWGRFECGNLKYYK